MMADPLSIGPVVFLGLRMGRSPMVVKEQFSFRPAGSIPIPDSRILTGHGERQGLIEVNPLLVRAVKKESVEVGIMAGE